jgi:hypothetical protein
VASAPAQAEAAIPLESPVKAGRPGIQNLRRRPSWKKRGPASAPAAFLRRVPKTAGRGGGGGEAAGNCPHPRRRQHRQRRTAFLAEKAPQRPLNEKPRRADRPPGAATVSHTCATWQATSGRSNGPAQ